MRHRTSATAATAVDHVIASASPELRITVLDLDTGGRGAPLNVGFERAAGRLRRCAR
ncbi:hypothetical protein [Nocardioides sp. B-3]|uniref:hypothetical protein n=1 Tax=Nocardioides sp. B-3 TaxID=2895565 RepID=UPI0021530BC9|nr:hypothetical protein [Nocardioides sp. B-3]UUZ61051.1 hypothetical protein LP418_10535 [Nocardioides sp. B-3]